LDALRAATEPVKVEAMQAIVVVWCFVREGCVCRNGDRDTRCEVKRKTFFAFFANHPRETDSKRRQLIGRDAPTETRGKSEIETEIALDFAIRKNDRASGFFEPRFSRRFTGRRFRGIARLKGKKKPDTRGNQPKKKDFARRGSIRRALGNL
jgi:hypothetical protein